jgi:hypothetical protein
VSKEPDSKDSVELRTALKHADNDVTAAKRIKQIYRDENLTSKEISYDDELDFITFNKGDLMKPIY